MILSVLLIFIIIYLVVTLYLYKNEVISIKRQLEKFKKGETEKKIRINTGYSSIEDLAIEINDYLEFYKESKVDIKNFENSMKQGIANMSHDLRTPLTSIIGYLSLLEKDEINNKDGIKILKSKADKLTILINNFFELATIESDDYKISLEKINLNNLVRDEVLSYYERFKEKNLEPEIVIPDRPIYIVGEAQSICRIISNLVGNTIRYADGQVKILVETKEDVGMLKISNETYRVEEEEVKYLFDRFYMADKVRKDEGTGLGLSIVKSLMDIMGGKVYAEFQDNIISITCEWKLR